MKAEFGASLSLKQCRNFAINPSDVLRRSFNELSIKRFRLMTYWDEHEKTRGVYKWGELDALVKYVQKRGGTVSMCLGVRQPRWPESHWPAWTKDLSVQYRNDALVAFIREAIKHYKKYSCIVEWQLENEALLKTFGHEGDFDRGRLQREFKLVQVLDSRPIVMTTSTSWGIPIRNPIPDRVGFSYYRIVHNKGQYRRSIYQPWIFKMRASLIRLIHRRPCFIHELQAEPWGPKNIWDMSRAEQDKSMSVEILKRNILAAKQTGLAPIDMWGLEWWYWQKFVNGYDEFWQTVKDSIH